MDFCLSPQILLLDVKSLFKILVIIKRKHVVFFHPKPSVEILTQKLLANKYSIDKFH